MLWCGLVRLRRRVLSGGCALWMIPGSAIILCSLSVEALIRWSIHPDIATAAVALSHTLSSAVVRVMTCSLSLAISVTSLSSVDSITSYLGDAVFWIEVGFGGCFPVGLVCVSCFCNSSGMGCVGL